MADNHGSTAYSRQFKDIIRVCINKQAKVYAQGSHPMLVSGAQLYDAQITMRKQGNVAFYTLDGYKVVQQAA